MLMMKFTWGTLCAFPGIYVSIFLALVTPNTSTHACCRVKHSLSEWTGKGKPKERSEVNLPKAFHVCPLWSGGFHSGKCWAITAGPWSKISRDLSRIDVDIVIGNYMKSTFIWDIDVWWRHLDICISRTPSCASKAFLELDECRSIAIKQVILTLMAATVNKIPD